MKTDDSKVVGMGEDVPVGVLEGGGVGLVEGGVVTATGTGAGVDGGKVVAGGGLIVGGKTNRVGGGGVGLGLGEGGVGETTGTSVSSLSPSASSPAAATSSLSGSGIQTSSLSCSGTQTSSSLSAPLVPLLPLACLVCLLICDLLGFCFFIFFMDILLADSASPLLAFVDLLVLEALLEGAALSLVSLPASFEPFEDFSLLVFFDDGLPLILVSLDELSEDELLCRRSRRCLCEPSSSRLKAPQSSDRATRTSRDLMAVHD